MIMMMTVMMMMVMVMMMILKMTIIIKINIFFVFTIHDTTLSQLALQRQKVGCGMFNIN